MAEKRKRSQNFTSEEKDKLVKLVLEHKNTILNKKTDGCTNEAKLLAWHQLTKSFNTTGSIRRTKESLLKVWEKLKSESKLYYSTTRRSALQTGGGPSFVKTDPILEQVCSIMGRGCSGIDGISDSDAQSHQVEVFLYPEENLPKAMCLEDTITQAMTETDSLPTQLPSNKVKNDATQEIVLNRTPLWSRKQPALCNTNEQAEAISSISSSYRDVNKKKDVESLKYSLLQEELEGKRELYKLQLQAAAKDLVIKDLEIEIKKSDDNKKKDVESLQYSLLQEELEAKRELYKLQLQAAAKDLVIKDLEIEIKKSVLEQVRGGLTLQNLIGGTPKKM